MKDRWKGTRAENVSGCWEWSKTGVSNSLRDWTSNAGSDVDRIFLRRRSFLLTPELCSPDVIEAIVSFWELVTAAPMAPVSDCSSFVRSVWIKSGSYRDEYNSTRTMQGKLPAHARIEGDQ